MAEEILRSESVTISHLGHREVHFHASPEVEGAVAPHTADDVFLLAGRRRDIGPARAGLDELAAFAADVDVAGLLGQRRWYGGPGIDALTGVEVSASFLGRRNYNRYDIEDAVGPVLARRLGTGYHSRRGTGAPAPPPTHSGWRLTLDGTRATLMLRVAARPLHRRAYKRQAVPGTLHPPLAAAMALGAGIRPGHRVLDPCCGAGTVLIEAGRLEPDARYQGFDLDRAALRAARANAAGSPAVSVRPGDAGELPLADGSVDRVVTNPPWGGQVGARGRLAAEPSRWWAELARVLAPDGRAVVLLPDTGGLATGIRHGLVPAHIQQVSLSGAHPHIVHLVPQPQPRQARRRATRAAPA